MNTDYTFILADNQDITRVGLRSYIAELFEHQDTLNASDKETLVRLLLGHPKSIVVLDYALFDLTSYEDLINISVRFPDAHWILFSNELSDKFIHRMSQEKSFSMVLKECPGMEIISALQCAAHSGRYFCQQITSLLVMGAVKTGDSPALTASETEVLKLIALGKTVKEIASERFSSIHTITTHKKNIFRKLGVNNVYEATKYALRAGLVEMAEYYI